MYLLAHQDDCEMVVGAPVNYTEHKFTMPDGEEVTTLQGIRTSAKRCTCEPMRFMAEESGGVYFWIPEYGPRSRDE